jgi:Holliday junction resolvasome RuvABC ATP-dependent DNA helicase subunit
MSATPALGATFLNAEVDLEAVRQIAKAIKENPRIPMQSLAAKVGEYLQKQRPATIFVDLYAAALLENPKLAQKIRF